MDSNQGLLTEVLRQNAFSGLGIDNEKLDSIARLFARRRYPRKALLLPLGDKWENVIYIHDGLVRLFYTDPEGKEFNKGFFWENQLIWPVAPSARTNESLFSIGALEELTISICSFTLFQSWLKKEGYWEKFALPYAEAFAERLFKREYEFLLNSATERYERFCIEHPGLVKRIADYHLASYLGITNVTLSRIKNSVDFKQALNIG